MTAKQDLELKAIQTIVRAIDSLEGDDEATQRVLGYIGARFAPPMVAVQVAEAIMNAPIDPANGERMTGAERVAS